jgi:TatA/E family protein of Tat protein translocase
MGEFSITHILIVLVLFLVFFGPKRLPQLGQSLGEAIRGFKNAMGGEGSETGHHTPPPSVSHLTNPAPAAPLPPVAEHAGGRGTHETVIHQTAEDLSTSSASSLRTDDKNNGRNGNQS